MNRIHLTIVTFIAACVLLPQGLKAQEEGKLVVLPSDSIRFVPHPPEKDAQIAVLYGNPREAGHFLIRLQFVPGWVGRPHTHPVAEMLLVRSGTCYLALGDDLSREAAKKLEPGSFAAVPAGTRMRGFAGEEPCVVDVTGQGPFTANYLDE